MPKLSNDKGGCISPATPSSSPHPSFSHTALCVVGNKSDLYDQREVSREKGEEFAHQLGAMFTETSAANNIGKAVPSL